MAKGKGQKCGGRWQRREVELEPRVSELLGNRSHPSGAVRCSWTCPDGSRNSTPPESLEQMLPGNPGSR